MKAPPTAKPEMSRVQEIKEAPPSPANLYASVIKEATQVDGAGLQKHSAQESSSKSSAATHKVQSKAPEEAGFTRRPPETSLFIRDRVPPWKQMVSIREPARSQKLKVQP